jgi:hypothetical protein
MRLHLSSLKLAAVTLSCLAAGHATAQLAQPGLERVLLSETQWTWQSADGPDTAVWFEKVGKELTMFRCSAATGNCRRPIRATAEGFELQSAGSWDVLRQLPGTPIVFSSDRGESLFPSWLVPTSGSRTGH